MYIYRRTLVPRAAHFKRRLTAGGSTNPKTPGKRAPFKRPDGSIPRRRYGRLDGFSRIKYVVFRIFVLVAAYFPQTHTEPLVVCPIYVTLE